MAFAAVSAQEAIFNFSFDNDLDGWTPVGVSSLDTSKSAAALWAHSSDGSAFTGAFASDLPILSISGGGAALFDSDGLDNDGDQMNQGNGASPAPQRGELISPTLDFTGVDNVLLVFNQFYRYFADDASGEDLDRTNGTASFIEVSNDGGTTFNLFEVNTDADPNRATARDDIQVLDITEFAANASEVVIKFVWDGDYYFWLIDDVRFFSEIGVNIAIEEFTVPDNFQTPDLAFVGDTVDLEVLIRNEGDVMITDSIQCVARILDIDLNTVWSDTGYLDFDLAVDSSVIWDFDEHYVPGLLTQNSEDDSYLVVYDVAIKGDTVGEIVKPSDNQEFDGFQVRDLTFEKVPGGSGFGFNGEAGGTAEPYDWANFFSIPSDLTQDMTVFRVFFEAFATGDDQLAGKSVILYVVELPDSIGDPQGVYLAGEGLEIANFDFSISLDDYISANQVIGIGSYAFSADDEETSGPFFGQVFDFFDDEQPVTLSPGKKYLFVIRYPTGSELIAQEVSRSYKLWQLSSLASFPSIAGGSWTPISTAGDNPTDYAENIAAIGFDVELISTSVDDVPLPENAVEIYPNPARDHFSVDLAFDVPTDVNVFLADASGKILQVKVLPKTTQHTQRFDVGRYPSGNYIVRIATREGSQTESIIVAH